MLYSRRTVNFSIQLDYLDLSVADARRWRRAPRKLGVWGHSPPEFFCKNTCSEASFGHFYTRLDLLQKSIQLTPESCAQVYILLTTFLLASNLHFAAPGMRRELQCAKGLISLQPRPQASEGGVWGMLPQKPILRPILAGFSHFYMLI